MKLRQTPIAKITKPRLPKIYARTRLFRLLDRQRRVPVMWVSGPPGSGKTTLVASYLDSRKIPCLWYQVDEGDADISTFFYYMGQAAKKAAPKTKQPLPLLTPEYQFGIPTFTRRYFDSLFSRLKRPFALVLDNYQEAAENSTLHETVMNGLSTLPDGITAILISRADPPPVFARMQANKVMNVIGWEQLRLTPEETSGVLRLHRRRPLTKESIRQIHEKTRGWAAGVILIRELNTRRGEQRGPVDMVPSKLSEYFAGEIFDKIDAETRDFLLKTALLPRMTPRMAEEITGNNRSGQILKDLNRRNYFTERRSEPQPTYQYHALFREFLLTRIKGVLSQEGTLHVQRQAAALLAEAGQTEDAAELFIEARDWDDLIRLILNQGQALVNQGRSRTLEAWLMIMPRGIIEHDPWLLYWLGVCKLTSDLRDSRRCFEQAYAVFRKNKDITGIYLAWANIIDTFVYAWSDVTPLDRWIAEIETLLQEHPEFPTPEIGARVASGIFCTLMYRQPHHPDLPLWEERVKNIILNAEDVQIKMLLSSHLILYYTWWIGEQSKAKFLVDTLRSSAESGKINPLSLIMWRAIEAIYCWMTAENQACLDAVRKGVHTAETSGVHVYDFMLSVQAVYGTMTSGDLEGAEEYFRRMEFITNTDRLIDICQYRYQRGWEALCRRDLRGALEQAKTGYAAAVKAGGPFARAATATGLADVLIESGKHREAGKYLSEARRIGSSIKSKTLEYQYLWLEAVRCFALGREAAALEALRRHLVISRECGILNHAWWRSSVMAPLYARALEHGIETDHVRKLIRKRTIVPNEQQLHIDAWPWPIRIFTLGKFEVRKDDEPLAVSKKAQKKPLQLLKVLIAAGGIEVPEDHLTDTLWPDAEGDAAYKALGINIIRLRRLLGSAGAVVVEEGRVTLDPRLCWVDVWAIEKAVESAACRTSGETTERRRTEDGRRKNKADIALLEKALDLYKGPFLADDPEPWSVSLREKLRDKFLKSVNILGRHFEQSREYEKAVAVYQRGIDVDDLAEPYFQRMMNCYVRLGRKAEALSVYNRCKKILATYDVEPCPETEALRDSLSRRR